MMNERVDVRASCTYVLKRPQSGIHSTLEDHMSRKKWRESLAIPQTPEQLTALINKIADIQSEALEITTTADLEAARKLEYAAKRVRRLDLHVHRLDEAVRQYALSHRQDFTRKGKLGMLTFPGGKVGWKRTPKAVILGNLSEEDVVRNAEEQGEHRFVRVKKVLDRQTVIKHPIIAHRKLGLRVESDLQFEIAPSGTPAREVKSSRRRRWERRQGRKSREVAEPLKMAA